MAVNHLDANVLKDAIYDELAENADLAGVAVGGVYHGSFRDLPGEVEYPLVTFVQLSPASAEERLSRVRGGWFTQYQVTGWTENDTRTASTLAKHIQAALHNNTSMSVSPHSVRDMAVATVFAGEQREDNDVVYTWETVVFNMEVRNGS